MSKPGSKLSRIAISLAAAAFCKYSPGLHRYLKRRIRGAPDVEDLTQEIFERFLRVSVIDSIRNPQAYLFRIASHVVSDALLQDEQSVITFDSTAVDEVMQDEERIATDDVADEVGMAQDLHRAIAQLPDMHRAVVLLAVRDGVPHAEVARRTGLSVSTVGLYVCEARARIRMALDRG